MNIRYVHYKQKPNINWDKDASNLREDLEKQSKYIFNLLLEVLPIYTFKNLCLLMKDYIENNK